VTDFEYDLMPLIYIYIYIVNCLCLFLIVKICFANNIMGHGN
jgi:hypothetical protein